MQDIDKKGSDDRDDDEFDACVTDVELREDEISSDEDLPGAEGGVELVASAEDVEVDGCDVEFNEADATGDEDLPAATGGGE